MLFLYIQHAVSFDKTFRSEKKLASFVIVSTKERGIEHRVEKVRRYGGSTFIPIYKRYLGMMPSYIYKNKNAHGVLRK